MTCEKFFAAVPWPEFGVALLIGFLLGYLTARFADLIRSEDR